MAPLASENLFLSSPTSPIFPTVTLDHHQHQQDGLFSSPPVPPLPTPQQQQHNEQPAVVPPLAHPPPRRPSAQRPKHARRLSSYEVFREEVPLWAKTHPLKPIPSLFVSLFKFLLISGPHWVFRVFLMFIFVCCMAPAWVWGLNYYLGSTSVVRNVRYGKNPRNYLDICLPQMVLSPSATPKSTPPGTPTPAPTPSPASASASSERLEKRPVLVFVTGGIWLIGYKAWGMFVAKVLSSFGIVVVLPDYRNFPQGIVSDMLNDVEESLGWVMNNIEQFGGDRNSVFVMGQSAGAHLALLTILRKAKKEQEEAANNPVAATAPESGASFGESRAWSTSSIPAVIGIAGPYNVQDLQMALSSRGLSTKLLYGIMGGEDQLENYSADYLVAKDPEVIKRMPPVVLLHGTADLCVPYQASRKTAQALATKGIKTFLRYYADKSHTDSIIEDLVYADDPCKEDMMSNIAAIVLAKTKTLSVIPTVTYEIKPNANPRDNNEPLRVSSARSFISSPDSLEFSPSYSVAEEFEVHVDSEDEILRPSFRSPRIESPKDFDLRRIRRSVVPWIMWKGARLANPF